MTGPRTRFGVLGPLEVRHADVAVPLPAGRARALLATLLLRANQTVSVDDLVERLWDEDVPNPRRARATLHMVVTRLRQALGEANVVRTATNGYVADVPPGALDLDVFRDLAADGRFTEALELWRGAPLPDVRSDVLHREEVAPLLEERLVVLERRVDADLAAGRTGELVGELRSLTEQHPLRERFWAQLMLALYRSGRQAEALSAYQAVRRALVEELGVDPGAALTELYERILRNEVDGGDRAVPRHVPPEVSLFVGRERELAALDEAAARPGVVLVHGAGGVGKTALALRWANLRRHLFPDGDLHLDLGGFAADSPPVEPATAAEALLVALGSRPEDVPAGLAARTAALRSALAGRRVLVVLDNAADSDQVIPLLPGTPTATVLVTSRNQLRRLAAHHGVRRVPLHELSVEEATDLLSSVLGDDRVGDDPAAGRQVVERCTGLPLALRVFAERVARFPGTPLGEFAAELSDERSRLDALNADDGDDTDVRTVLSWSYRALDEDAARLFRLLSAHPGPHLGVKAAAALAALPGQVVRRRLERLTSDHLIGACAPGRYEFHDLLRAYSTELSDAAGDDRKAALRAVAEWYARAAELAASRSPSHRVAGAPASSEDASLPVIGTAAESGEWTRREMPNLLAVCRAAAGAGWHELVWRISDSLWWMSELVPRGDDLVEVFRLSREAVRHSTARDRESQVLNRLGWVYAQANRHEEAVGTHHEGLAVARAEGNKPVECAIELNLGTTYRRMGRHADAVVHQLRGLALAREQGDEHRQAAAHSNLSPNLAALNRNEEALEHASQAVAIFDRRGDRYYAARASMALGAAHRALGRFTEAEAVLRRGVELLGEFTDRFSEAILLDELGTVLLCLDRRDEALDHWGRAAAVYEEYEPGRAEVLRRWLADHAAGPPTGPPTDSPSGSPPEPPPEPPPDPAGPSTGR
ncbi:BTAD domain-containing putative transcriptional regulator [Saccharothrix sp. Mg75]|uniref:AfsR/SARP family transcriptional regulator n=1 Tax=Saccharothrix sp. Mg75 TaxID=3445357 RepID=UPI003EEA2F06